MTDIDQYRQNPKKFVKEAPWGRYDRYLNSEEGTLKMLQIKKGEHISLQLHETRDEFWLIIKGNPMITLGPKDDFERFQAEEGDEFFIPKGTAHRAEALDKPVTIMAISYGHFDPDDKERLHDKYDRD